MHGSLYLSERPAACFLSLLDFTVSFTDRNELSLLLLAALLLDVGDWWMQNLLTWLQITSRSVSFVLSILYPLEVGFYPLVYLYSHYFFIVSGCSGRTTGVPDCRWFIPPWDLQALLDISPFKDKVFIFVEDILEGDEIIVNPLDLVFSWSGVVGWSLVWNGIVFHHNQSHSLHFITHAIIIKATCITAKRS